MASGAANVGVEGMLMASIRHRQLSQFDRGLPAEVLTVMEKMKEEQLITEGQYESILDQGNLDSLVNVLQDLPAFETHGHGRERRRDRVLSLSNIGTGFLDRMRRFENSFNTICQVDGFGCVAWGLMKFLVVNPANDIRDAGNMVRKGLQEFVNIVSDAEYDLHTVSSNRVFSRDIGQLLMSLYQHVFQFLLASIQFVRKNRLGSLASLRLFASAMLARENVRDVLDGLLAQLKQSGQRLVTVAEALARRAVQEHYQLGQWHYQLSQNYAAMTMSNHSETMSAIQGIQDSVHLGRSTRMLPDANIHHSLDWDHQILDGAPSGTFFIGRNEELALLRQGLVGSDGAEGSHRVILSGLSGMGKSQLAREHDLRFSHEYQLIFWFDCTTENTFQLGIDHLVEAVGMKRHVQGQSPSSQLSRLKTALRKTSSPWLFILDNCNEATVRKVLAFVPLTGGDIIFTTNHTVVGDQLQESTGQPLKPSPNHLTLGDLPKGASADLLLYGLSQDERPKQTAAVMQIVGQVRGLPSLLRQLRMLSRDLQLSGSYEEVLTRMQYAAYPLLTPGDGLGQGIGTQQIQRLLDSLSSPAKALVQLLCCFLGSPVPELVLNMFPEVHGQKKREEVSEDGENDELVNGDHASVRSGFQALADISVLERSICEIQRRYLISRTTERRRKLINLHPAVAYSARSLEIFRHSPADSHRTLRIAIDLSNAALPQYDGHFKLSPEDWADGETMLLPAIALETLAREVGEQHDLTGSLKVLYEVACRKFFWTGDKRGTLAIISAVLGDISQPLTEKTDGEFAFAYLLARVLTYCYQVSENESYGEWVLSFLFRVYEESKTRYLEDDMRSTILQMGLAMALACNNRNIEDQNLVIFLHNEVTTKLEKEFGKSDVRVLSAYASIAVSKAIFSVDRGLEELNWLEKQVQEESVTLENASTPLLWRMARAFEIRGQYDKMHLFAKRNFEIRRGAESRSHQRQLWDFLLYAQSLMQSGRWNELEQLLQGQKEFVDNSRWCLQWIRQAENFKPIYSLIFSDPYHWENMVGFADAADIETYVLLDHFDQSRGKWREGLHDDRYRTRYDVAVLLDCADWDTVDTLIENVLTFRTSLGGKDRRITSRPDDQQGIHWLLWVLLLEAQDIKTVEWYREIDTGHTCEHRPLNPFFVDMWYRIWTQIEAHSAAADLSLDTTSDKQDFYDTPAAFKPFVIRVSVLGHPDVLDLVLERKPDIHIENNEGRTAFYYAALLHHFLILKKLLQNTGEKRPKFYFGSTSLLHLLCVKTWQTHESAQTDQVDLVLELLKRGHRPDYRHSPKQSSPVELAENNGLHHIVRILKNYCRKYSRD